MEQLTFFLVELLCVLIIGAMAGALTRLFEYVIGNPFKEDMNQGAILSVYGRWILKNYNRVEKTMFDGHAKGHYALNMWKAAGVCPFCVNVYISLIFGIVCIVFSPIHWWLIFAILAVSHFVLGWILEKEGY